MAIAYGENITDEFGGMLAPPNLEGDFVLSLHNVEVTGGALSVVDQWMDARPCEPDLDHEQAIAAAAQWLAEMDDDYYLLIAGYSPGQDQLRHDGSSVKFTSHVLGR